MAKTTQQTTEDDVVYPKYRLDKLRQNSTTIFGVTKSTFDGATHKLEDGEYTIPEIKTIISDWERKEAK